MLEKQNSQQEFSTAQAAGKDISVYVAPNIDWDKPLRSVVCVDDNEAFCESMSRYLADRLSQTIVFKSIWPECALKLVDGLYIDCLVSDMDMPGMYGDKFINAFKIKSPCTFALAITGYSIHAGYLAGQCKANSFMEKSSATVLDDILGVVKQGLDHSRGCIASHCRENYNPEKDAFASANWRHVKEFKEFTGYSPKEYETARRRLKAIALLMKRRNDKVHLIAGFQSRARMMKSLEGLLDFKALS
ncbi:MAG: response regulator [Fibrobacterota bacterium]